MKKDPSLMIAIADKGAPAAPAEKMIYVPMASLQVNDDSDQSVPPAAGDKVSFTVDGVVRSIDGDQVCIDPEAFNGQPVSENESPEEDAAEGDDEGANLRSAANKADQLY